MSCPSVVHDLPSAPATHIFPGASAQLRSSEISLGRLPQTLRLLTLGIGALHTWVAVTRQSMSEDGINYLDMGEAFLEGDGGTALNTIWSPLYAVIVGAVQRIVQPSIWWEFPVVQMTNFVIFAAALFCFEFFWRQLPVGRGDDLRSPATLARLAPRVWLTLGYSLFIWSSLSLITIWAVTPDMLVAALVYLAAGLLLRMRGSETPRRTAAWLGLVLGVAYLAKAAMFPLGLALILVAATVRTRSCRATQMVAWTLVPFALISGPLVVATSAASGYLTFGDVGRFTYMKHVNGLQYPHWEGSLDQVDGAPEHPPRLVSEQPHVYEFAEPIKGTYPLAFDPGYWTRGLSPRLDAGQQLRALVSNVKFYFDLFVRQQGGFVAVVLLLAFIVLRTGFRGPSFSAEVALAAWALCAFGLYALVYVESRYVAPFVVVFWGGALAWLRLPAGPVYRHLAVASGAVLALLVWLNIAAFNLEGAGALSGLPSLPVQAASPGRFSGGGHDSHPEIADGLLRLGVKHGDTVGFVGDSFAAYWARLARVRIVAEVPSRDAQDFWDGDPHTRVEVLETMARAGAVALIAAKLDASPNPPGWHSVGEAGYVVHFLR